MINLIAIGCGGALGALARYGAGHLSMTLLGHGFPYGTLIVNIVGSLLIGLCIGLFAHFWQPSEALKLLLITGFLGGFTTFSAFSLDVITLFERGEWALSGAYIAASIFLSLLALAAGLFLMRWVAG